MIIYLVGPISGQSYDAVTDNIHDIKSKLSKEFQILHPMMGKEYLRTELRFKSVGYDEHAPSTNHAIFERDKWMVNRADIILANLLPSGDIASIGSCMELAWAALLGKLTIVVMQEDNIHQHSFVLEAADVVFPTMYDAIEYLNKIVR